MTPSEPLVDRRARVVLFGLLLLVPLLFDFTFRLPDAYTLPKLVLIELAAFLLTLLYLLAPTSPGFPLWRNPFDWPLIMWLAATALSLSGAINIWDGLERFFLLLALYLFFQLALNLLRPAEHQQSALILTAAAGVPIAIYGIAQQFGYEWTPLTDNLTTVSTLGHRDMTGQILLYILPASAALLIARNTSAVRILASLSFIGGGALLLFTKSRGAWIAAACQILICCGALIKARLDSGTWRRLIKPGAALLALMTVGLLIANASGYNYMQRFASSFDPGKGTARFRLYMWTSTLHMIRQQPWTGVGAGNFQQVYPLFRDPAEEIYSGENVFVEKAHNDTLHQWSEQGLLGLFAWLYLWIMTAFTAIQVLIRQNQWQNRPAAAVAFLGLCGTFVHGMFSFNLSASPATLFYTFIAFALLAGPAAGSDGAGARHQRRWRARLTPVTAWLLIGGLWFLVAVAAAVIPLTAGFFQKRGESLMDLGQYDQALPSLRAAARIRPHDYKNHLLYGYCLYQQQHYGEALDAFHIARGLFPNFRNIIYDIAHVYQAQADGWERRAARLQANSGVDPKEIADALSALEQNLIQAVTSYEEALALDSRNLSARNNLALSYRRLAKFDRGRRAELTASLLRALGVPLPLTVEPNALLEQALSGIEVERDKQARELIEDSLLIHPHSPDLHNNLGVVLFSLGRYQQAFAAFLNVLELRNTVVFPQAILNHYSLLGELHFRIGAIAADGRWIVPFGSWGTLKFSALAESVPTIINSDRGGTFVWNDDLQVLELHFAEAPSAVQYIVEYRTPSGGRQFPFAQNDQVYAKAANNAGRCLELLDRAEEAEKYYRQALTITPAYPSPLRNLLRLLAGQELRQSEARQLLSQYVALDPELVDAPDLRPWAESLSSR